MKNTIKIDAEKLQAVLELTTGKTLAEIAVENGYNKELFRNVIRRGEASANIQAVCRLYGIEPSAYELKPATEPANDSEGGQLTIDDLITSDAREVLKDVVKEALAELINNYAWACIQDPIRQETRLYLRKKEEG